MIPLRQFLRSPLARHPNLLARKIASRIGLAANPFGSVDAPVTTTVYPAHWKRLLVAGINPNAGRAEPRAFNQVFGHHFDEALLLELCRTGPRVGERGLTGDIKLIWDYSRGHALWPNALHGHLDHNLAFLHRWIRANEDLRGPAWVCAMDVALRAVNWIFSDAVTEGRLSAKFGLREWAQWLWRHGIVIWHQLETRINSNNHYLADLLGLAVIGSIFPEDSAARKWIRFARKEFPQALLTQTRPDGGLNEASLRYHAFVTEMALLSRLALGQAFPVRAEKRIRQMCQIVADFRDCHGDVFPLGDDDSGRVLVDWEGEHGRADSLGRLSLPLLETRFTPSDDALYPHSGWWCRRTGNFVLAFEFGGVGLNGQGSHAHNDDLSFCLEWQGRPVIVDPGSYLYTSDPDSRNEFRSVKAHNTLCFDQEEPRILGPGPFRLQGRDAALPTSVADDGSRSFRRNAGRGLLHRRAILVLENQLTIRDTIEGNGPHALEWRFQLAPGVKTRRTSTGFVLTVPGAGELILDSRGSMVGAFAIETGRFSPAYGQVQPIDSCLARMQRPLPAAVEWTIAPRN